MSQLQLKLNLPSEGHLDTGRSAWARRQVGIIRVIGQPDAVAHSTPKAGLVQPGPVDQPELAHGPGVGSASALPSRRGHLHTALNRRPAPAEEDVAFSVGSSQPRQPQANVLSLFKGGSKAPSRESRKQCQSTRFMVYPSTIQQSWASGGAHAPAFKAYLVAAVLGVQLGCLAQPFHATRALVRRDRDC